MHGAVGKRVIGIIEGIDGTCGAVVSGIDKIDKLIKEERVITICRKVYVRSKARTMMYVQSLSLISAGSHER